MLIRIGNPARDTSEGKRWNRPTLSSVGFIACAAPAACGD
jgi:hypothetical protein